MWHQSLSVIAATQTIHERQKLANGPVYSFKSLLTYQAYIYISEPFLEDELKN